MALIETLTPRGQTRNSVHDAVETTYFVFEDGGRRYLQINTYGRPGREFADIPSQKIQLNARSAAALLAIIKREFRLA